MSCSPERVTAEGKGDSSGESGLATDSESEDGPIVETETDSGNDDSNSSDDEDMDDPCHETICERDEACLGARAWRPGPRRRAGTSS